MKGATTRQRPTFTPGQRRDLQALGLHSEQIEELEKQLQFIKFYLDPLAKVADIRDRWKAVEKPLASLRRELTRLSESNLSEGVEARVRIVDAAKDQGVIDKTLYAINVLGSAFVSAKARLPTQRRDRGAATLPIRRIDGALLDGFIRHFPEPMPAYLLKASRAGIFAKVVSICYQAVGRDFDPDRAIRKYVKEVELRTKLGRKAAFAPLFGSQFSLPTDFWTTKKAGRPRGSKRSR